MWQKILFFCWRINFREIENNWEQTTTNYFRTQWNKYLTSFFSALIRSHFMSYLACRTNMPKSISVLPIAELLLLSSVLQTSQNLCASACVVDTSGCRGVKSSRPKWPWGQNFALSLGLGLEAMASALASVLTLNIWPRTVSIVVLCSC